MVERARSYMPLGVVVAAVLVACQPVDDLENAAGGEGPAGEDRPAEFADLGALEDTVEPNAREWDGGSRLVEVSAGLDEEGRWRKSRVTYVAPDADRMFVVALGDDGTTVQQPTLETLGFVSPTDEALREVPSLPDGAVPPERAAEVADDVLDECGIDGDPREVLYATGAPAAWDGSAWTADPAWSVSVLAGTGGVWLEIDGSVADEACFAVP
jgi:hypothetical protein